MVDIGEQTSASPAGSRQEPAEGFPKADVLHRFIAKFIDFLIVAALARLFSPVGFFAGMIYLLIADGLFQGRSAGKRLIGLQTLRFDTGTAVSFRESILRNVPLAAAYLCLIVPYIGWLAAGGTVLIEALLVIGNLHGHRVGDEIAKTQVVDQRPAAQEIRPERPTDA
ncbi:MAG: RDD family protein [Nitrospirae bacterium]|nr:RDD family protein [Nitrospirota bacterium]